MRLFRTDDGATGLKGDVQPFVQIQRNGVSAFDPVQLRSDVFSQDGDRADRAVHVEPEVFAFANICQGIQVIHCTSVDRPCAANDTNRAMARFTILREGVLQSLQVDGVIIFYGNFPQTGTTQPAL